MPARKPVGSDLASIIRNAGQQAKLLVEQQHAEPPEIVISDDGTSRSRPVTPRIFNILDYIEGNWGLGMSLFPAQRFLVKLYYHLPLEDKVKTIDVRDMLATKVLYHFTEKEYLKYLFDEGRCNIGEQDHDRRQLILAIGRRAGKCVEGDTLVYTDKGLFRIEDLGEAPEEDSSPLDIGVVQEAGKRSRSAFFYNGGVKPTFKVITSSGYAITGTGNHRVKVLSASGNVEWRYLDEIRVGDLVALNRGTDLWASDPVDLRPFHNGDGRKDVRLPDVLDENVANLLGYLVGDGTWGDGHAVSVTVEHPETWEHLRGLFTKVLGEPRTQMDTRTDNTGRLEFCSVRARRLFDSIGWKLGTARDEKMVPWSILRSPRPVVCAFLRGLFETDGCAESGGRHITFSSASFRLTHEMQVVLLNLGILSNVSKKWNVKTKKHYAVLSVKGVRSRRVFAESIGFDSAKKMVPLLASLEIAQEGKSDTESIPFQYSRVRDWLESVPKRNPALGELGWGRSKLREALGNCPKASCNEDLTYPRLRKSLQVAKELGAGEKETAHFEELLRLDYFYDPVSLVEEGEHQVYDLTVPDGESFVANGMTNHNTTLSGIFASYEVYRLLNLRNPQEYYGLPNGNRIQIISVATDKDQAGILFNEVTTHLAKCDYFKPFIANNTQSHIQFRTPYDIDKFGPGVRHENGKFVSFNGKATLRVTFKSCIAKGLRGAGNYIVILDEMAHFQSNGQSSAAEIYNAVTPSAAAFSPKDPENNHVPVGDVESRIICISSPLNKSGKFFDLYHTAMSRGQGSENMLAIQAPTWEVNPTLPSSYYRQKFHEDPAVFMTEHGAQFSDQVRAWIEREVDLLACIEPARRPVRVGIPRAPYQMGIDVGLINDGTAVYITHVDEDRIILDYYELWVAGVDWRESNPHLGADYSTPYCRGLGTVDRLDFDEIANWIHMLTHRFYTTDGLFDRWNGLPLEQALHKKGLSQFRAEFFPRDLASKMFQVVKLLMMDKKLALFDWPVPQGARHSPFITELLSLQAEQTSKNLVTVKAPETAGSHDDMSDAFVRAVWLSAERIRTQKHIYGVNPGMHAGLRGAGMTPARYQMMRARKHGGFTERTVPRSLGLRLRSR